MSTVADILKASKYDLKDYGAKEFDETQMVHYLNRCINILDRALISLNSDQTLRENGLVVVNATNSSAMLTNSVNVREIWDNDEILLTKVSTKTLYHTRMRNLNNFGKPKYWAQIQNSIEFDISSDSIYAFTMYHDVMSTTVVSNGNMPYEGIYDEYLREALILMAQAKKNKKLPQTDAVYLQMFKENVQQDMINRNFVPRARLDF